MQFNGAKKNHLNNITMRVVLIHAFIGWILCAATMGVGAVFTTMDNTLYIHAILAPVFFCVVSLNYFRKNNSVSPIKTVIAFVAFVIIVDFFIVAIVINRSLEMFSSVMGTWIPFILIFISTYVTGTIVNHKRIGIT